MDEKSTEIKEENRKVKRRKKESKEKKETVLLLCLTSILHPVWLGWATRSIKLQPA